MMVVCSDMVIVFLDIVRGCSEKVIIWLNIVIVGVEVVVLLVEEVIVLIEMGFYWLKWWFFCVLLIFSKR